MNRIRRHLSFANVMSVVAVFLALGGTSLAAVQLTKNSVGAKQIKKNAVRASEIKTSAVGASEIRSNAVAGGDVADGTLGSGDLGDNSVGSSELGDNSVGGGELANSSVGSGEVTDDSLTDSDLATGAGAPTAYARIDSTGTLIGGADQNKGIVQTMVQHTAGGSAAEVAGTGVYCFGGLGFDPKSAVVSTDNTDAMPTPGTLVGGSLNVIPTVAIFKGEDLGYCNATHGQVRVGMEQVNDTAAPTLANHGFIIQFQG